LGRSSCVFKFAVVAEASPETRDSAETLLKDFVQVDAAFTTTAH